MHYDHSQSSVKKPKDEVNLTEEQAKEMVKCALDIEYFLSNYVWVQGDKGRTLFKPRPYQTRLYDALEDHRHVVMLSGRQSGKSSTVVGYALWQTIFNKDHKFGFASYRLANCKDLMNRFKFAYENLPFWMKPAVTEYNRFTVSFVNGSSVEAQVIRENTFRGNTPKEIFIDELAFVSPAIAEEFWGGLLPSLMGAGEDSDTSLIIASTPNGTGDLFSDIWFNAVNGTNGFYPVEVKYEEIPGRTEKFEKDMIAKFGKTRFLIEFRCQFLSDKSTLINTHVLESLKHEEPVFYPDENLTFWVRSMKGMKVAISCDVGEGVGKDYHAIHITDVDKFEQIGEFRNNTMTQTEYTKAIIKILQLCWDLGAEEVYYTVENNSIGLGILTLLQNSEAEALDRSTLITHHDSKKPGMPMNTATKPHGCQKVKDLVELGKYKIRSKQLINELKFFVRGKGSFAAENGKTDDLCMSLVLMMLLLEQLADYEETAYDKMSEVEYDEVDDSFEVGIF